MVPQQVPRAQQLARGAARRQGLVVRFEPRGFEFQRFVTEAVGQACQMLERTLDVAVGPACSVYRQRRRRQREHLLELGAAEGRVPVSLRQIGGLDSDHLVEGLLQLEDIAPFFLESATTQASADQQAVLVDELLRDAEAAVAFADDFLQLALDQAEKLEHSDSQVDERQPAVASIRVAQQTDLEGAVGGSFRINDVRHPRYVIGKHGLRVTGVAAGRQPGNQYRRRRE